MVSETLQVRGTFKVKLLRAPFGKAFLEQSLIL